MQPLPKYNKCKSSSVTPRLFWSQTIQACSGCLVKAVVPAKYGHPFLKVIYMYM